MEIFIPHHLKNFPKVPVGLWAAKAVEIWEFGVQEGPNGQICDGNGFEWKFHLFIYSWEQRDEFPNEHEHCHSFHPELWWVNGILGTFRNYSLCSRDLGLVEERIGSLKEGIWWVKSDLICWNESKKWFNEIKKWFN